MRYTIKTLLIGAAAAAAIAPFSLGQSCEYWEPLGPGTGPSVQAVTTFNGELIAAGSFHDTNPATPDYIAKWDGAAWQPMGNGLDGAVHALTVWNNQLVAGGEFHFSGGQAVPGIALWNGSSWLPLGNASHSQLDGIDSLTVYKNEIIAGGSFAAGLTPALNLARWDGDSWEPLGDGTMLPIAPSTHVNAMVVLNELLYIAGSFESVGGVSASNIAVWNTLYWSYIGNGTDLEVHALCVYEGGLIAGGDFHVAGSTPAGSIARWDPVKLDWVALGQHLRTGGVFALTVHGADLVAAGDFVPFETFTARHIARWRHGTWTTLGSGMDGDPPCIHAMTPFGDRLVAAGCFAGASGVPANGIAIWTDLGENPTITNHPASLDRCLGQTATFAVQAYGDGPLGYQWTRDGINLADDGRITGSTASTLTVAMVNGADAGTYECNVATPAGCTAKCAPATLDVAIGDFNCSGLVSVQDIFDYLTTYFAANLRADINGSGDLSVQDVLDFLRGYFAGL
jgi:hypothetical protein